ncbi:MAG TPA: 3'-5' exonuclease, partial [Motiliproteus sp.]
ARHGADNSWQMDTNWRSVPAMVQGYNRLFWGGALGQPAAPVFGFDIAYEPVKAAKAQQPHCSQLQDPLGISAHSGEDARAALNYVWLTPQAEEYDEAADKVTAPFRHAMASWCCAEIHRLLCETRLGAVGEPGRALEERDIAILVRTGTEAAIVQQALLAAGYPSVYLSARDNIFASAEAAQLAQVLQGILACEETRHLIAAYATELLGGDAALLAQLNSDADALVAARTQLLELRARWQRDGFIPMMLGLIHDHLRPPPARHERCLTNHIHLAELLQQASGNLRHPQQLLEWLRDQIATAGSDSQAELRLESDANLIRIITQHGSKGLEYPVVFVPFANYGKTPLSQGNRKAEYIPYHDPASGVARELIGRTPEAVEQATAEAFAEAIRLLYVAVTRAEQRCYLCCAPFGNSADSPLARTLGIGSWGGTTLEPEQWPERLAALVADDPASSALLCLAVTDDTPLLRSAVAADASALAAAEFSGRIERDWRISSFSALTRNLGHSRRDRKDHDDDAEASNESGPVDPAQLPLRFRLAKGAHAGNLLHDVLEHTDFSAPRWEETLRDPLLRFGQLSAAEQTELQGWLQECLATALPPILSAGGDSGGSADALSLAQLTLAQLTWPHTLREAEFYFPLNHARLPRLADILRRHRGSYDTVELPGLRPLQGMMHG